MGVPRGLSAGAIPLALAMVLWAVSAAAQAPPLGPDFLMANVDVLASKSLAINDDGDFMVAWVGHFSPYRVKAFNRDGGQVGFYVLDDNHFVGSEPISLASGFGDEVVATWEYIDFANDQLLIKDALFEVRPDARVEFVSDGVELLEFMRRQDRFADRIDDPLPRLVLLDLNMPVKDGREALFEIKSDPSFWRTPIVIFSTSTAQADIRRAYNSEPIPSLPSPPASTAW